MKSRALTDSDLRRIAPDSSPRAVCSGRFSAAMRTVHRNRCNLLTLPSVNLHFRLRWEWIAFGSTPRLQMHSHSLQCDSMGKSESTSSESAASPMHCSFPGACSTPEEYDELASLSETLRELRFLEHWVRQEALVKLHGLGIGSVHVSVEAGNRVIPIAAPTKEFVAALATREPVGTVQCWKWV